MHQARHRRSIGREQIGLPIRAFAAEPSGGGSGGTTPPEDTGVDQLYQRAGDAARRGRWAEAVRLYREVLTADPGHSEAHNNLALVLERAGEPDMALDELATALRQQPDRVELLVNRGAIYAGMKRYEEAEADLRRAIRLLPSHADAHFNLGMVHWRRGLPEEATGAFRRAVDHDPGSAAAWYYLGEALNQTGDPRGALEALERSAQLKPDGRTFLLLGRVLDRLSRPTEAIEMYRQARDTAAR